MKQVQFYTLLRQVAGKVGEADVMQVAASMAFYTLFSLFPLILLLISIGSILLKDQRSLEHILRFVGETFLILLGLSRVLAGLLALIVQRYQLIYGSLSAFVAFMFYIYLTNLVVLTGVHVSVAISGYFIEEVT